MIGRGDRFKSIFRQANLAGVVLGVMLCVATILTLATDVKQRLEALARADSDNIQWLLSQVEVELLRLADSVKTDADDLARLRERYDIFYSRIGTLESSPIYEGLKEMPVFEQSLSDIRDFLDRSS